MRQNEKGEEYEQRIYLTPRDTAKRVRRSIGSLANDRLYSRGLPFIKFGSRVLYDLKDIDEFMEKHKVRPKSLLR